MSVYQVTQSDTGCSIHLHIGVCTAAGYSEYGHCRSADGESAEDPGKVCISWLLQRKAWLTATVPAMPPATMGICGCPLSLVGRKLLEAAEGASGEVERDESSGRLTGLSCPAPPCPQGDAPGCTSVTVLPYRQLQPQLGGNCMQCLTW
jgi:hypothetical protein